MLESKIGYTFKNKKLLEQALTRRSYSVEHRLSGYNQRLEFLGDSVLGLSVAEELYKKLPKMTEGELTKLKASIVCEKSLYAVAEELGIADYLLIGKGEKSLGVDKLASTTSDALEAIFGAVFLDSNFITAKKVVLGLMESEISKLTDKKVVFDSKSLLQEKLQRKDAAEIIYTVVAEDGPEHDKTYTSSVEFGGKKLGEGSGRTKKEAEKSAAYNALVKMKAVKKVKFI